MALHIRASGVELGEATLAADSQMVGGQKSERRDCVVGLRGSDLRVEGVEFVENELSGGLDPVSVGQSVEDRRSTFTSGDLLRDGAESGNNATDPTQFEAIAIGDELDLRAIDRDLLRCLTSVERVVRLILEQVARRREGKTLLLEPVPMAIHLTIVDDREEVISSLSTRARRRA